MLARSKPLFTARFAWLFRHEFIKVSLVLAGTILIFFSGPLLHIASTYYSPVDMLQSSPVYAVDSQRVFARNPTLGDDIYTYLPWIELAWRSMRQGELPLWNPYNAGGRPLLANMQSSIFYPSQWPGFFLGERLGLLIRCMLHLFMAGLFSFYFFRTLKMRFAAALPGAIAFMFGGMMTVWLYNELSATFLLFPLLLLVIERRLNRSVSNLRFVLELGLTVMLQIFGGHPETLYLSVTLASFYLLFRLATDREVWGGFKKKLLMLGLYAAGGLWGIVLGAVQLLPFVEYLLNSNSLADRAASNSAYLLPPKYLLSFILPDPFGNPTFGSKLDFTNPNYSEISGAYIGPTIIFLALASLWIARKRPLTWFFWAATLVAVQVVYQIGPVAVWFHQIQPISILYNRLMGYIGFFLVTLAVFALNGLLEQDWIKKFKLTARAGLVVGAGVLFLAVFGGIFWWFSSLNAVPFNEAKVSSFEVKDFLTVAGWFVLGLFGLAGLIRFPRFASLGILALGLALFGQLALFGANYRGAIDQKYFYPVTATVQALQKTGGRVAPAGSGGLFPPEANIWYGIEQVNGYDSLEVRWFDQLRRAAESRWPDWTSPVALNLFNIKQVVASNNNPVFKTVDAGCCDFLRRTSKQFAVNIYQNQNYQPLYRMVYSAVREPETQAVQNLLDGQIDPLKQVVFADNEGPTTLLNSPAITPAVPVTVTGKTFNRVYLKVHNPQPGYLYIDQTYFPGWEAQVNQRPARLYRANVAFTALELGQGDFTVELDYNPFSFLVGALLTGAGLLLTLAAAITWLVRKRRKREQQKITAEVSLSI